MQGSWVQEVPVQEVPVQEVPVQVWALPCAGMRQVSHRHSMHKLSSRATALLLLLLLRLRLLVLAMLPR